MRNTMRHMLLAVVLWALLPPPASAQEASRETWRWAFRSNTLLPLLNAGVGVTTGPKGRFSFGMDWHHPWMRPFERDGRWCLEAQALSLEVRWTFRDGTDPLRRGTGLSLGLTATGGYYDLGLGGEGVQGEAVAGTLDAGWTWAVSRGRLRLGVIVGGGFMRTQWRGYRVYDDGRAYRDGRWTRIMDYWGPTKAELRLSVPFWYKEKSAPNE